MWWIITICGVIAAGFVWFRFYPTFGGRISREERLAFIANGARYSGGKFINLIPTSAGVSPSNLLAVTKEYLKDSKHRRPATTLSIDPVDPVEFTSGDQTRIIWFGHSTFLLFIEGQTILVDPMLGRTPSPFPAFGGKRYSGRPPLEAEQLPSLDAVLITHDHYDHLDYGTIKRIKDKVGRFFVPQGIRAHLIRWGVRADNIEELGWWDATTFGGLTLACTPARHFSGRRGFDQNATLWCSWVVKGRNTSVFCSGDSGYGPHFKEIGEQYGPFDVALVECGQYNASWEAIHMMPEQTVQAHLDVQARLLIPIHWGAFTLALHAWTDPIERIVTAARQMGVEIATPRIGQTVVLGDPEETSLVWWR
ncbi:MBL fold metallo-hydrolase [Paenibacillus sp. JCM 10914]|uniref:MBL fold metallo-hydrolase n=1 Tax=Paenibacillus sp. JCM 10914 TaxID=1236974 RepID=UPI0003CCACAB|nr:MBL fold metallo-hydrolase [Paenibacillus sp. JCM 10914]GAE09196.1 outer membrane protein romA [Paenibacillus sp. JCM 10914]